MTDPARAAVLVDVRFAARSGHALYVVYDPALSNTRNDDIGSTQGRTLVATDGSSASALTGRPRSWPPRTASGAPATAGPTCSPTAASMGRTLGHRGQPRPDRGDRAHRPARPRPRHAGRRLRGRRGHGPVRRRGVTAPRVPRRRAGVRPGWHAYLAGLDDPPSSLRGPDQRTLYRVSAMVLAASEDKTHRGAYVAAPAMPWIWGRDDPSGPYHLVWSRDLYQIATALIAAGDTGGANRALDYLFDVQQKPDGSFPQNSHVNGTPVWTGLQLDEVALPIVLAYQLGRTDAGTWSHVKRAADFLLAFQQDGNRAPWSPQDRWENQSGYSPATIASQIAGLVCAAHLAQANGDAASAQRYLATADDWQARVKGWTVTTTGPYSEGPYFLRLTKDGNPNAGTTYTIGDSGPSNVDQRLVVDPSFLDLVRLGVLPADDPAVVNSLAVIDEQLGVPTARGFYWHRASFDGYGEKANGDPWEFGLPDDSRITLGRAWPLLNGERGEYHLAAGDAAAARAQITTMARAAGPGAMLPEQVWDLQPPAGTDGFVPGTPTFSATPLAWTHAQFIRLARDVEAGRVLEQPAIVAQRYTG